MNIIDRNFYRLLRSGTLNTKEQIEPLSAWKWKRLYQLSQMHDVAPYLYKGIQRCQEQFFVQIPPQLLQQWATSTYHEEANNNKMLDADHLTNPVLNTILQNILDEEGSNTETRTALLHICGIARFIMNAGVPVKRVTELGIFLRQSAKSIDFNTLQQWITRLRLAPMAQLSAVMLVRLLHFSPSELSFLGTITEQQMERVIREMLRQKNSHSEEWYFQQGKDIFVHTSNSSAMMWHVQRTARYFRYYPTETVTNFFASFAHSLSHIEE